MKASQISVRCEPRGHHALAAARDLGWARAPALWAVYVGSQLVAQFESNEAAQGYAALLQGDL